MTMTLACAVCVGFTQPNNSYGYLSPVIEGGNSGLIVQVFWFFIIPNMGFTPIPTTMIVGYTHACFYVFFFYRIHMPTLSYYYTIENDSHIFVQGKFVMLKVKGKQQKSLQSYNFMVKILILKNNSVLQNMDLLRMSSRLFFL